MNTFLDRLRVEGEQFLDELITSATPESLTLEFKSNHQRDPIFQDGNLTKNGRGVVAKELSAFANSLGGTLVLGVNCRNVDGVDAACELTSIGKLSNALSSLTSCIAQLTHPSIAGLDVFAIQASSDPSKGYLVVDVPRSEVRPHRSAAGQKGYFKRSATSTVEMEHYEIQDAFLRTQSAIIEPEIRVTPRGGAGGAKGYRRHFRVDVGVRNRGTNIARYITLGLHSITPDNIRFGNPYEPISGQSDVVDNVHYVYYGNDIAIHRDQVRFLEGIFVSTIDGDDNKIYIGHLVSTADSHNKSSSDFCFEVEVSAENANSVKRQFILRKSDLLKVD